MFSSALFMVSTCTMSFLCVTSVSMMSEWCVHILHFLSMRLRLSSTLGSHFLAAVSTVFNFTEEPCPFFACNCFNSLYAVGYFAKNDLTKSFSFALLFKIWKVVTYTFFLSVRLKSIKLSGYCSLISVPMIGGMLLSSNMVKKKGVNFDLIFRMITSLLSVYIPSFS